MKTLLICHEGAEIDQECLASWLASFSDLVGLVVLQETYQRIWRRARREIGRSGIGGLLNVLAFRIYYRLFVSRRDKRWEREKIAELRNSYPEIPPLRRCCAPLALTLPRWSSSSEDFSRISRSLQDAVEGGNILHSKPRNSCDAPRHLPGVPEFAWLLLGPGERRYR